MTQLQHPQQQQQQQQQQQEVSFILHVKDETLPPLALDTTLFFSPTCSHIQHPWKMTCTLSLLTNPKSKKKQFLTYSLDESAEKTYLMLDSTLILEADREIKFIFEKLKFSTTRQVISIKGTQHIWQEHNSTERGHIELFPTHYNHPRRREDSEGHEFVSSHRLPVCWIGIGVMTLATTDLTQGLLVHVRLPSTLYFSLVLDSKRDKQSQMLFSKSGSHTLTQFGRARILEWLFGEWHTSNSNTVNNVTTLPSSSGSALSSSTTSEGSQHLSSSSPQITWSDVILFSPNSSSSSSSSITLLIKQYTDFFKRIGLLS